MCLANSLMWPNVFLFTTYHKLCAQHVLFLCGLVQVNFTKTGLPRTGHDTPVTPSRPTRNRPQTDKNHQIRGEFGLQSVLIRFCRFGVGLYSGRQICRGEIFQTCLKDLSPTNCWLSVGYMSIDVVSVLSGSVRGRVSLNSATDGRWFVVLRSVMYRAYVGRPDTDSRPIQDQIKSDITPNCVESADTFPNQNRRVPDISRTQTECKRVPITVCGVIPTSKSSQNSGKYLFTKVAT